MKPHICISGWPPRRFRSLPRPVCALLSFTLLVVGVFACAPELPVERDRRAPPQSEEVDNVRVELDPPSALEMAPPILRVRLSFGSQGPVDVSRVFFVQGQVSPAQLRQITKAALSKALTARIIPSLAWIDEVTD